MNRPITIAVDFDGTIVTHDYPEIGDPVPGALESLKAYQTLGWRIILYTMRSGIHLEHAVKYLKDNGIEPWGINNNPEQSSWTTSPKVYANYYIDDAAVGCPLMDIESNNYERPYVNWVAVNGILAKL